MAPEPIEYQVIKNLQTALLAIAVASGYHFTMAGGSVKLDPNVDVESLLAPDGSRPWSVIEVLPEEWQYFPAMQLRLVLPVTIHWIGHCDQTDDNSRQLTYLRGCADVERAIAVDISRAGLAVDTRIQKRTLDFRPDGSEIWALIDTQIILHRTFGQPDV